MVNLRITDFNSLTEPLSLNNNIDFFSILNQIINTASDLNCCSYSFRQFRVILIIFPICHHLSSNCLCCNAIIIHVQYKNKGNFQAIHSSVSKIFRGQFGVYSVQ